MASTGFLRTVNFGGFDKKDVLTYVDELNTKIYNLENELNQKTMLLDEQGSGIMPGEGDEKYEAIIAENRATISELKASVDTLKLTISNLENDNEDKAKQVENYQERISALEEELESAKSEGSFNESSFDIGSVFIEAKHSADRIITEARNAAKKCEADSKALSQQIIDEANMKAESIVSNAQADYDKVVAKASAEANIIIEGTNRTKMKIMADYDSLTGDIEKLATCLNEIVSSGALKLSAAKKLIDERKARTTQSPSFSPKPGAIRNDSLTRTYMPKYDRRGKETLTTDSDYDSMKKADSSNNNSKKYNIDMDFLAGLTAEIDSSNDSWGKDNANVAMLEGYNKR